MKTIVPEKDMCWQRPILSISNDGTATKGNRYIVGESPTGAFSGFTPDDIVFYDGDEWQIYTPEEGWIVYDLNQGTLLVYMNGPSDFYWYYFSDMFGSAGGGSDDQNASEVPVDTTNFNGNLSSADDTVQKALETLDDLSVGGGSGGLTYAIKNADQAKTSDNTLADDNTMFFTTLANKKYFFMFSVGYLAGSTPDIKFKLNHTGTTTSFQMNSTIFQDDFGGDNQYNISSIATVHTRANGGNNNGMFICHGGMIDVGASGGTFSIQWAQNTSNIAASTVKRGSYLAYKDIT